MIAALRILAMIFLAYFFLLGLFGALTWVKFMGNLSRDGAEMVDSLFLFGLMIATGYYGLLTVWTFSLYEKQQKAVGTTVIQLSVIFLLGICSSFYGLYQVYT